MDNLTHSLVGALIGQAGLKRKTGLAMPALIIGANIPDVDAACLFWLDGVQHLAFRRGITHGPIAWLVLPLVLAAVLYAFDAWQAKRGNRPGGRLPVSFKWLLILSFIGCLTHPAFDWLNSYGIRFLEPFSQRWFYGDILFIIDVWLWAIMGTATWLSLRREKRGGNWRRPARVAIAASCAYIGLNAAITASAAELELLDSDYEQTIANPVPVKFWQRDLVFLRGDQVPYTATWRSRGDVVMHGAITDRYVPSCDVQRQWKSTPDLDAFLFWSRAPFAESGTDGAILLRDARFYDPLARGQFSVTVADAQCVPSR